MRPRVIRHSTCITRRWIGSGQFGRVWTRRRGRINCRGAPPGLIVSLRGTICNPGDWFALVDARLLTAWLSRSPFTEHHRPVSDRFVVRGAGESGCGPDQHGGERVLLYLRLKGDSIHSSIRFFLRWFFFDAYFRFRFFFFGFFTKVFRIFPSSFIACR